MAAVTAAGRGLSVLLLEKMDQAGRKLRITGKGRCNLTNTNTLRDTLPHIGSDARFLRNAYGRFFNRELMDFFEGRGVPLVVERGNRVYPASGKALDIFLALIGELEANPNVTIRKNTTVKAVETFSEEGRRQATAVILERGERIACRHVVLATGGMSYPTTGSTGAGYRIAADLGHTVVEPVPSLVALRCAEKIPQELVGFQLKNVELSVYDAGKELCRHFGEMTFCDDGLAGPIGFIRRRSRLRPPLTLSRRSLANSSTSDSLPTSMPMAPASLTTPCGCGSPPSSYRWPCRRCT